MLRFHRKQLAGGRNQFFFRQETVTGQKVIIEFKQDTGFHSSGIIAGDPQFNGKPVHSPKGCFQTFFH